MRSGIYVIENQVNGKRYIGSAKDFSKRWSNHTYLLRKGRHPNVCLQQAWSKYGAISLKFRQLLYCDPLLLTYYEQSILDAFEPEYNICVIAGSTSGRKLSEDAKDRIRKIHLGKVVSTETRERLRQAHLGKSLSDDHRKKVSQGLTGIRRSKETKRKMSIAAKAREQQKRERTTTKA